jgi:hypothetical protein
LHRAVSPVARITFPAVLQKSVANTTASKNLPPYFHALIAVVFAAVGIQ